MKIEKKAGRHGTALSARSYLPLALTIGGGLTCSFYAFTLARGLQAEHWGAWVILLGGLALTASVAMGIAASIRTTRHIKQVVADQTRELRQSEKRYRTITENTSDWIWETDANATYTACVGNVKAVLGYEAHELVGRGALDVIPAEEGERIQPHLNRAIEAKAPFHNLEHWVDTRSGGRIYVCSDGVPILDEEMNLRGYHGVTTDITRRKMAEDEARQHKDHLEELVEERTESLRRSNEYLQREIAERRRAESTLSEREQQLRDIADRVPGLVYQFYARPDGAYGFHYVSEGVEQMFGVERVEEDSFGQFLRRVHEDDVERLLESVADAVRERKPWEFEGRFVRPSEETLWFRAMAAPEERAREVVFNGLILDITEVRQAEEGIREKERLLNATLESTADGIEVTNQNGNLLHFNARFAEMWEIPESVLLSDDGALLTEHMAKKIGEVERLYASSETGLDTLQFSDGRVLERFSCPLTRDGEVAGQVLSFRDVTERVATARALRESEEWFRTLVDHAADAFFLIDMDGRILDVNKQARESLGYSREELLDMSVPDVEQHCMKDGERREFWHKEGVGATMTREGVHRRRDGTAFPVEVRLGRVEVNNRPAVLALARDVSERKRAEADLKEAHRKLVATARRAGMAEVATGVLHNVGNVLNSVGITTDAVRQRLQRSPLDAFTEVMRLVASHEDDLGTYITQDERGREIPAFLADLAKHLAEERDVSLEDLSELKGHIQHISDIVTLQQAHSAVGGLTEPTNLGTLLEEALQISSGRIARYGIEVVREFETVPQLVLDPHRTLQILVNLIRNAQHALITSEGEDKRITLRIRRSGETRVRIEVEDNGIGISKEDQQRLFTHGFTTKEKGHGLGLHSGALSAKDMGGVLSAESAGEGKGATFTLTVPCREEGQSNE